MGSRYEVWRCEFEKFVRLQARRCELLEKEAREEKESEGKTEEDRPPTLRTSTSAAFGDVATFTPEKAALRRQAVAEEEGGVVDQSLSRPEVVRKLEEGSKLGGWVDQDMVPTCGDEEVGMKGQSTGAYQIIQI